MPLGELKGAMQPKETEQTYPRMNCLAGEHFVLSGCSGLMLRIVKKLLCPATKQQLCKKGPGGYSGQ